MKRFIFIAFISAIFASIITTTKQSVGTEWILIFVLPVADRLIRKWRVN
jgi:hypothetical protein